MEVCATVRRVVLTCFILTLKARVPFGYGALVTGAATGEQSRAAGARCSRGRARRRCRARRPSPVFLLRAHRVTILDFSFHRSHAIFIDGARLHEIDDR